MNEAGDSDPDHPQETRGSRASEALSFVHVQAGILLAPAVEFALMESEDLLVSRSMGTSGIPGRSSSCVMAASGNNRRVALRRKAGTCHNPIKMPKSVL